MLHRKKCQNRKYPLLHWFPAGRRPLATYLLTQFHSDHQHGLWPRVIGWPWLYPSIHDSAMSKRIHVPTHNTRYWHKTSDWEQGWDSMCTMCTLEGGLPNNKKLWEGYSKKTTYALKTPHVVALPFIYGVESLLVNDDEELQSAREATSLVFMPSYKGALLPLCACFSWFFRDVVQSFGKIRENSLSCIHTR